MSYNNRPVIENLVAGDDWIIRLTIVDITDDQELTDAWFTVKENIDNVDDDAVLQKHITAIEVANVGHIEDTGSDGTGVVRFNVTKLQTVLFKPYVRYEWDVQVKTDLGKYNTPRNCRGYLIADPEVTKTT